MMRPTPETSPGGDGSNMRGRNVAGRRAALWNVAPNARKIAGRSRLLRGTSCEGFPAGVAKSATKGGNALWLGSRAGAG